MRFSRLLFYNLIFQGVFSSLHAQNLIDNGSFEIKNSCISWYYHFTGGEVQSWTPPLLDTILPPINSISGPTLVDPCNLLNFPSPISPIPAPNPGCTYCYPTGSFGNSFANLYLSEGCYLGADLGEFHEFLNQFLQTTLIAGEEYTVEFWSQMHPLNMQASIPPQLMITEDTLWQFDYLRKNLSPLITSNTIFTDTVWRKFSASFVATGQEIQLTIGHFYKPQNTPWVPSPYNPGSFPFTYNSAYFVDAVSLFKSSDTLFTADLGPDTLLCPGEVLTLQPDVSGFKLQDTVVAYLWSTGSTDSTITVNAPGTYWVEVTFDHRFVGRDTIQVSYYADNLTLGLQPVVEKCFEQTISLSAANIPFTTYLWNTGEQGSTIFVSDTGLYYLEAQTPCYGLTDSTQVVIKNCNEFVYIPNAFTPNGDGLNDYFEVFGVGDEAELLIYNRWGELVFQAQPYLNNWDATYHGQPVEMGVYLYKIKYPLPGGGFNTLQGTVMVLP